MLLPHSHAGGAGDVEAGAGAALGLIHGPSRLLAGVGHPGLSHACRGWCASGRRGGGRRQRQQSEAVLLKVCKEL